MTRSTYYEEMKALAREIRADYGLVTPKVMKSDLRRIYKDQGIHIDLWPHRFKELRGAYFDDDLGPTVVLARGLPDDPMIFTMGHELKHHLVDRGQVLSYCSKDNERQPIEIGAEVFSAELIYPERDFADALQVMGVTSGQCAPDVLVRLKHTTQTTLSYAGLAKRAERLGFAPRGSLTDIKWKKLEEELYGVPIYKCLRR